MKILNERKCNDVIFNVNLTDRERSILINYGMNNIPLKDLDEFLINWAIRDILEKQLR